MSNAAQALVWAHSKATGTARLVMLAIADHDGEGGSWPSYARLAAFANVDPRNARRAVDRLVELGELNVIKGGGGRAQTPAYARPNLYIIKLACPPYCDHSPQHRDTRKRHKALVEDVEMQVIREVEEPDEVGEGASAPGGRHRQEGEGASAPGVGAAAPTEPSLELLQKSETVTSPGTTRAPGEHSGIPAELRCTQGRIHALVNGACVACGEILVEQVAS